ncbi:MAG: hypothetical protein JO108_25870 [Acidobacteriaceae bacterium]|nr:hypothetical protein [Acidobacteriaceae bacterium]
MLTSILVAAGIAGPFVPQLPAQDHRMAANIPFALIAGKKVMPARRYELTQSAASGSSFAIRNADGITAFVIAGIPEKGSPDRPHLTFACYGKECVLAKIGPPQSMTAYSLSQRSIEKNLHHTLGVASMVSIKLAPR